MDESNKLDLAARILPAGRITLEEYRRILSYPAWGFYSAIFIRTRSYEQGLKNGMRLIEITCELKDHLAEREYNSNMTTLWLFVLSMLDKLDRWIDYLAMWERLRKGTVFTWKASLETLRRMYGTKLDPWIVLEEGNQVYVHFLWGTIQRKELIEKKLQKSRNGERLGNMVHRKREELSEEDIQERFDRVVFQFEYAKRINDLVKSIVANR